MGKMIYNNISTLDMGVIIQAPPVYEFPSRNYENIQVEGRHGDLLIDKKSYNNVRRTYRLALVFRENTSFINNAIKIVEWLTGAKGYVRLEDSYDPEHFKLAVFKDNGELQNIYDKVTAINATFDCKPQRYLKNGEELITIPANGTEVIIFNPTNEIALPEIILKDSNEPIITIKNEAYNIHIIFNIEKNGVNETLVVDSEVEEAYSTTNGSVNTLVTITEPGINKIHMLKLYPGFNKVSISNNNANAKLTIKPRWWRL